MLPKLQADIREQLVSRQQIRSNTSPSSTKQVAAISASTEMPTLGRPSDFQAFELSRAMTPVSIFNDVIGPVMRGPSSSHCAAALRIGRLARDLMDGEITEVLVEFRPRRLAADHAREPGQRHGLVWWVARLGGR
jgi:hypothetical protein